MVNDMWQDILKVQVLDTSTSLSTINEPMIEDKDCCEQAKFLYKKRMGYEMLKIPLLINSLREDRVDMNNEVDCVKAYDKINSGGIANQSCEKFKERLYLVSVAGAIKLQKIAKDILDFWEECENE